MKEAAAIIVLYSIIKLTSFGVWNVKNERNITGAAGVIILDTAMIFYFLTLISKIF